MKLTIATPIKAYLKDFTAEDLETLTKELTYTNTSVAHLLKRHYNNKFFRAKNPDAWAARMEELKKEVKKTLIYTDEDGTYIRPGSIPYLNFPYEVENLIKYPTPKAIPWHKPLPFMLHPYQALSASELVKNAVNGPVNVELCTGSGKSAILLKVARETGFKCAIIAPSKSIFLELVEKFEFHFGKGKIGKFGNGSKKLDKNITICIGDSVANIKPGSKEWEFFSNLQMMCVDESHTWGADTLEEICHGVLATVPYRMFFSGTQTRGDGGARLLQSIIGKTVHKLSTAEAVAGGYICPHEYRIVELESSNPNYMTADALDMKRVHFLGNRNICSFVAKLANSTALASGQQTLVLVEELNQISMLTKLLTVPFAYAHSETKPERLAELGLTKVDPAESVEKFNKNEVKVLIGTSCIATGTNIYPTHNTINWVGGASEIKTKQGSIGRSVRKSSQNPYKEKCLDKTKSLIWDFNVSDIYLMSKHLEDRITYYEDSGSEIIRIRLDATKKETGGF